MSKFYTRSELALRSGFFYGSALLASAFGSLLAAGIIAGIGPERYGIAGWRFLFYIEGAATIGLAIIVSLCSSSYLQKSYNFSRLEHLDCLCAPEFPSHSAFLDSERTPCCGQATTIGYRQSR